MIVYKQIDFHLDAVGRVKPVLESPTSQICSPAVVNRTRRLTSSYSKRQQNSNCELRLYIVSCRQVSSWECLSKTKDQWLKSEDCVTEGHWTYLKCSTDLAGQTFNTYSFIYTWLLSLSIPILIPFSIYV